MTQEPPKRDHWQHQQEANATRAAKPATVEPEIAVPVQRATAPAEMTTSSIPKPESSRLAALASTGDENKAADANKALPNYRTTEKVRMRKEANTSSAVVTMLKGGQKVDVIDTAGAWKKVSVAGQTGWVRGDYLIQGDEQPAIQAAIPRPKADVGAIISDSTRTVSAAPAPMTEWDALRPARAPQGGDCQCPYDLMLNGKQCGGRSAYAQGRAAACYF